MQDLKSWKDLSFVVSSVFSWQRESPPACIFVFFYLPNMDYGASKEIQVHLRINISSSEVRFSVTQVGSVSRLAECVKERST